MVKYQLVVEENTPITLHPPPPANIETFDDLTEDDYFYRLSKTSEFRRLVYKIRTDKTHRGTKEDLDKELWKTQKVIEVAKEINKYAPTEQDRKEMIHELKQTLDARKAKFEQ